MQSNHRTVVGASILSAGASMPLHLLPVLVLSLTSEGRLDAAHAGWVGSAYMIGQLCAALALPLAHIVRIPWQAAAAAVLGMLACAWLSNSPDSTILLASWLAIGCLGGTLHYLASTTAAASADQRSAFALRMGASSALGSCLILALQVFRPKAEYESVVALYMLLTGVVGCAGLALLGRPAAAARVQEKTFSPTSAGARPSPALVIGMVVLFCLFVGQHGLWAFAVKGGSERGLPMAQLLWAVAICKMVGAVTVFATARTGLAAPGGSMRWPGAAVAVGGATVAFTAQAALFWMGLLFWESG